MKYRSAQDWVDLIFSISITQHINMKYFKDKSREEIAEWVAEQLRSVDIDTRPMGASWGVITFKKEK
jgi:hypothetical protein